MSRDDITAPEIELAIARHFNYRQHIIVPNVTWGWGLNYEADIVVLTQAGYAWEIEIKTTAADIRADLKKHHHHDSKRFKLLWFAVPEELAQNPNIPAHAGILAVKREKNDPWGTPRIETIRGPVVNRHADKLSDSQRLDLLRLAAMRTWNLKAKLETQRNARIVRG